MDLPLVRLRQITANIQIRRFQERREENSRVSWLARIQASYIAMGYMVEKGQTNEPLQNASLLAYDDIERAMLKTQVTGQQDAPAENKAGSYESLMRFANQQGKNKG